MSNYRITLRGCICETRIEVELDEEGYKAVKHICKLIRRDSTCATLFIEQIPYHTLDALDEEE